MMRSPLCFPVFYKNRKIFVLDETKLPFDETYIEVKNLDEAKDVLKTMKTRAFGQVLLFLYSCILTEDIDEVAKSFKDIRPTFDFFGLASNLKEVLKFKNSIKDAVDFIISSFEEKRRKRAKNLAKILPNFAKILTICNVNGELIYLYEEMKNIEKKAEFYISETRPYLQGTRLTLWELKRNNIPTKLICDNQAAYLMKEGKINCVIVGSDRSTKDKHIINKVGTYALAVLAKYFKIPFYVLTQMPKDIDINKIEIEERDEKEVFMWLRKRVYYPKAVYPSFDITLSKYISFLADISGEIIKCE